MDTFMLLVCSNEWYTTVINEVQALSCSLFVECVCEKRRALSNECVSLFYRLLGINRYYFGQWWWASKYVLACQINKGSTCRGCCSIDVMLELHGSDNDEDDEDENVGDGLFIFGEFEILWVFLFLDF